MWLLEIIKQQVYSDVSHNVMLLTLFVTHINYLQDQSPISMNPKTNCAGQNQFLKNMLKMILQIFVDFKEVIDFNESSIMSHRQQMQSVKANWTNTFQCQSSWSFSFAEIIPNDWILIPFSVKDYLSYLQDDGRLEFRHPWSFDRR